VLDLSPGVRLLDTISSAEAEHFGFGMVDLGDIDGDGVSDFAIGSLCGTPEQPKQSHLEVFSGRQRHLLYTLRPRSESARNDDFGIHVVPLGDLDLDGAGDFVVFGRENDGSHQAYAQVFSGCDGQLLTFYGSNLFDDPWLESQAAATALGDRNGDGFVEFALSNVGEQPRSTIVSGKTLAPGIIRTDAIIRTLRDWDGDGREELLCYDPFPGHRFEWIPSKTRDAEMIQDPFWSSNAGAPLSAVCLDWKADGILDLLQVWQPVEGLRSTWDAQGCAFVFTVSTLLDAELVHSWREDLSRIGSLGAVESVGDLDGDGFGEILVTVRDGHRSPDSTLKIYSSKDGALRWWIRQRNNGSLGATACGIGDVDGDGRAELLVGDHEADWTGTCRGCAYLFSFEK
jgi:hypothetical protein